ncbi:lipoprotein LpqV [Prescottella agglutinans]|uniref:Lipoprotein n=1 Tax=Prescottella agglutinans TaxID=1644129 RepID=A0ABT6M5I7_9NOCA|nr:lipoprotein LpqV [Prescottella agglutinans]MDH6279555.1 hypothetical protein [Prescottella agglutinans]
MRRTLLVGIAATALLVAGCSSNDSNESKTSSSTTSTASAEASHTGQQATEPSQHHPTATADIYEVTAAGLTTAVNVPVAKTAAEMADGCREAKVAFEQLGTKDYEVVLALFQATPEDSTEGVTISPVSDGWASSTPQEQAAIIAAVKAAANGEC